MNKFILVFIFCIFCAKDVYASTPDVSVSELRCYADRHQNISDLQLKQAAINCGIIPEDAGRDFIEKETKQGNSITAWVMFSRESKLIVANKVIEKWKQNNIKIKFTADYYVNEINKVLYNSILKGDIAASDKRGLGAIFKTIAIMDGNFDNGMDKIELLKKQIGKEVFKAFKEMYPDKYRNLLKK